jgi:hypothetical protein
MDSLADIPAVDGHAHPLKLPPRSLEENEFRYLFTEARREPGRVVETVFYRWAVREIAEVLGLEVSENFPELETAVLSTRASDPTGYTRRLFAEANLEALLLDTGYGGGSTLEEHEALLQGRVFEIKRVESVAERLLTEAGSAAELLAMVEESLLAAESARGFKTVAAYRGGLTVQLDSTAEDTERAFKAEKVAPEFASGDRRYSGPCCWSPRRWQAGPANDCKCTRASEMRTWISPGLTPPYSSPC